MKLVDKKLLRQADWLFLGLILLILLCSLIALASASLSLVGHESRHHLQRQLWWVLISLPVFGGVALFDYRKLTMLYRPLYIIVLFLLTLVLFAPPRYGARRWLNLGFFDFQPSELAKIVLIIVLACYLSSQAAKIKHPLVWLKGCLIALLPLGLILVEPDLGTTIIGGLLLLVLLWLAGANRWLLLLSLILIGIVITWLYTTLGAATNNFTEQLNSSLLPSWLPLEGYQLLRLVIFVNPYMDPLGSGYHMIQSRIAIGAGGLWGRGFGQGSQVQGDFLPEHHTDFIFSAVGEEFGFIGAVVLLALYLLLFLRGWQIALKADDLLGSLLVGGIMSMLALQLFLNIGMAVGLMPITGITLPLLSYGGSSLLFNMTALGLVFSVSLRQEKLLF